MTSPTTLPPANAEQTEAIRLMLQHATTTGDDQPFFALRGPAGRGKTFTISKMMESWKGRVLFCAPTNKAVRVLRDTLRANGYRPEAKTIYSALGLQMAANGEVKELKASEDEVDLNDYRLIVVDETSMLGAGTPEKKGIWRYILEASANHPKLRWIFMGDHFQLPPVGEVDSPVWVEVTKGFELTINMRQDNQIVQLVDHLRDMVAKPFGRLNLQENNDGEEGVWVCKGTMDTAILNHAQTFLTGDSKAIAWRNVEVDRMNALIRRELFADSDHYPWQVGDRITLLGPVRDLEDELIGTTDEEGTIERVDAADHPIYQLPCYRIVMQSDSNTTLELWVLQEAAKGKFTSRKARLAAEAKADPRKWPDFWNFVEAFHPVRHGYATTAHRAQGSTYYRAFVSWRDILLNPSRGEAMRCLYVAASRPKKELYLG